MSGKPEYKFLKRSDETVDVTEGVECYENGKVFRCECGQGIGVPLNKKSEKCYSCNKICVDREYDEREPPDRDEEQTGLGMWT